MAKRNQVTTELRISADAQLKNSRSFISQLDRIIDKFDFGDKINNQLVGAKNQLKDYNKILEKVQTKKVISEDETKTLQNASKEMTRLIEKTEKLYMNLSSNELKRFSKDYIKQTEEQEKRIAKIKEEYRNKYNSNFDKDYAGIDKLEEKVKSLNLQMEKLKNSKDSKVNNAIELENKRLQSQFELLQKIKKVQDELKLQEKSVFSERSTKSGFSEQELKSKVALDKDSITKDVANSEYQEMLSTFKAISNEKNKIYNTSKDEKQIEQQLIDLASKYNIKHVQNTKQFEKQYALLEKQKNFYRILNNREQLATNKLITEETRRRTQLLEEQRKIEKDLEDARKSTLSSYNFNSISDLNNQKRKANKDLQSSMVNVTLSGASLSDTGESAVENSIVTAINAQTAKLQKEIDSGNNSLEAIKSTNDKLSTQSERQADEQDLKNISSSMNEGLKTSKSDINNYTNKDNSRIAELILRQDELKQLQGKSIPNVLSSIDTLTAPEFMDDEVISANKKQLTKYISDLNLALSQVVIGKGDTQEIEDNIQRIITFTSELSEALDNELIARNKINAKEVALVQNNKEMSPTVKQKELLNLEQQYNRDVVDFSKYSEDIRNLQSVAFRLKDSIKGGNDEIRSFSKAMDASSNSMSNAITKSQFLGSTFDDLKNKVGYFLSMNYVFDQIVRKLTDAVNTTKEMDKDMTQIGLVLGKTSGQVWKNFDNYSQAAERLNTTTSQVTQSMKLFYQQGLNTAEVNKMVEASAIAAALGESSMAEASETLTSIINSYNLSATEAMNVTDKISQIAIVSAADFGELSTAIEKVASSAASAGLDLDHMMGYLAKMIETTREAPTNIGTALKTIVANFTQFKEDPSGLTEEGSEINKVDKALKSVGISLTDTNGEVRDLGEVLDELGGKWKNLNRNQRAYLATQIAGNRQQSRFYALMNDYDRTLELVAEGSNSAGKAQQQFALYSNSLEASANRLTNQWEKFFNSITEGNGVISKFTNTLTGLMKIINIIGPIGTVFGIGSLIKSTREAIGVFEKLQNVAKKRNERTEVRNNNFSTIKNSDMSPSDRKSKYAEIQSNYMKEQLKDLEGLNKAEKNYIVTLASTEKQQEKLNIQYRDSTKIIDTIKYRYKTLKTSASKTWASIRLGISQTKEAMISLIQQQAILLAAMLAFKIISTTFTGIKSALNLNTEAHIANAEAAHENSDNINGLMGEYEELSKKVNKTVEEQERLKEITEEVIKIDGKLGQQLKDNANNYQQNIKAMKEYADLQEKIAIQESSKAIRSETNKSHTIGMQLFDEDLWTNIFGSESDKKLAQTNQDNQWRLLSSNRAAENDLNDAQSSMLSKYTEDLIKIATDNEWSAYKKKYNTDDFDEEIMNFINSLKQLNTAQQQSYEQYLENLNNENYSWENLSKQLQKLNLPQEIEDNLTKQLTDLLSSIKNQIDSNNYIQDKNKAYGNVISTLSVKDANNLFNPDKSTMTDDEYVIYQKDLAKFTEDGELLEKFKQAQLEGGDALQNFSNDLQQGGKYTNLFANSIYDATQTLTSEQFEKALSNLLKIGDLDIQSVMKGDASQLDILKELGKGNIDFKDLNITENGTISVNNSRMIAEQEKNFKIVFDKLYGILNKRQTEMDNLSADDNPAMAAIIGNKDEQLKLAGDRTRVNSNYEGGYQQNWKVKEIDNNIGGWLLGKEHDATEEYKNKSIEELEAYIQKWSYMENSNSNRGTQVRGAKMSIAEQRGQGITKDTSEMDNQQKSQYLKEQIELYNQQSQKIAEIDKNSQDYYDTTYKIKTLENDINGLIDKGIILEEDKNKINKEYNGQIDKQRELNKGVSAEISKQIQKDKERLQLIEKQAKTNLNFQKGFAGFFDGLDMDNTLMQQLDGVKTAYQQLGDTITDTDQLQQTLASNPALMQALDVTSEGLTWNKQKLEELGIAAIDESHNYIESKINDMEATKATLATQSEDISNWSDEAVTDVAAVIGGNSSLTDTEKAHAQSEATNLGISEQSWITWSDSVCKAIKAAGEEYNKFLDSEANKSKQEYKGGYSASSKVGDGSGGEGSKDIKTKKEDIANTLKSTGYSANKSGAIDNINKQIDLLKGLQNGLKYKKSNIGKYLGGDLYGDKSGGGSKDKFDAMLEKLDKFYNYMRQIEALEAKINKLREKRNLIDATKNYYIEDLKEENKLLEQQAGLYGRYIKDQTSYLAELRSAINSTYGDWAYFNNEGVVQVKQTEFNINSEAEQERYESFSELLQEYQDQYNTMLENQNKLYEIQSTVVENIKTQYDKILARVTDVTEELQRQADLLEHDITMSFSNIAKFDIMDEQLGAAVEGIKTAQSYINGFEKDIASLNEQIKNGPYSELLQYDQALGIWRTNEEKLNNTDIVSKYEKMGYTWSEVETYVKSVAAKSEAIRNSWKETEDSLNGFLESLKQLIDDRISLIQDFFSSSTDEINKIFDTFDRKVTNIDNMGDLFGASSEQLEDKYLTLVTAVSVLKQTIQQLKDNRGSILDTIKNEYPEYIDIINGVAVVNKQAIEESTKLTEQQKAELLQLYGIYEASGEQIDGLEDKLIDYFNTMMEMEEAKRDAIIDLKQQVHDELIARDQEEIDDLRSKYDKMSQLDNEYYTELQQRVNDARNLRQDRQQQNNINQMQARLAVLQTSSDSSYNKELIDLQKQLNDALQTQADNDITRELERIAREQKEREEDRQMQLTAMENVLTFKDDNNWYWQEAERIWAEGPESVIGWLASSREMMNTSDENRALQFENLTTQMNTAFTTLQTAAGETARVSDGIVTQKSDEEQLKLDNINGSLGIVDGSVNAVKDKIDWTNAEAMRNAIQNTANITANANAIKDKMFEFYKTDIKPGTDGIIDNIESYLGQDSSLLKYTDANGKKIDLLKLNNENGFLQTVKATSNATQTIVSNIQQAKKEYVDSINRVYDWLDRTYRKEHAGNAGSNGNGNVTQPSAGGSGNAGSSNAGGATGGAPNLSKGSTISVKPGTRWYYDSYGTSPSGIARGGKITYTNLKAPYAYNIEGLGWIRKQDIVGYSKGGYVDYTGVANVHGSQTEPEAFLNAKQTRLFEGLRDTLLRTSSNRVIDKTSTDEVTKEEYNIGNVNINVKEIADADAIDKVVNRVKAQIYTDSVGKNNMAIRRR